MGIGDYIGATFGIHSPLSTREFWPFEFVELLGLKSSRLSAAPFPEASVNNPTP